ncbi:thymidine kinase [[Clostridium] sordellii]|uniref:Thymidine kinase n=1 Tax=Paraclostridium sordellii TaxID=1505 RepID=A0A0A1SFI2_PARSO|nr:MULTISPECIES: thymidine kinase [Paeniclostridium]EPZ53470.1 thymidine kinase [[Clostridium] sordellii ATCC 9714] [Paeniclostridium sordellii ATCC 9714]MDU5019770.1 thymidine kinase [Clostridiales bacterium]MTN16411.1 thymidine kinase [Turicibacter sanguinis]AUN12950.1 thymidine kinase [Paeniclostridium sordellii]EPZ54375.1 thymidine kinase [[Clostridium] sordellii VPI 9048] [Paeniclostridium sordellii VPI 9048]
MYRPINHGYIEVVIGPMYSGKSEELIRRLKRARIAKQNVVVFKPIIDDRYSKEDVVSHSGYTINAIPIKDSSEMMDYINDDTQVVGIDEVQFFDDKIVDEAIKLADNGVRVIAAGLDMDFKGEPFGPTPRLLAVAEFVDKIQAICSVCGQPATRSQRLINGEPARYDEPIIQVGAVESYEARCRKCHVVKK